jgi:hypothetical protein
MSEQVTRGGPACNSEPEQSVEIPKRRKSDQAPYKQLVTFILVENRQRVFHRTYESADHERKHLEAKTGKAIRVIKVLNCDIEDITSGRVVLTRDGEVFEMPSGKP